MSRRNVDVTYKKFNPLFSLKATTITVQIVNFPEMLYLLYPPVNLQSLLFFPFFLKLNLGRDGVLIN